MLTDKPHEPPPLLLEKVIPKEYSPSIPKTTFFFLNEWSSIRYLLMGKHLKMESSLIPLFLVFIAKKVGHSFNKQLRH